MEKNIYTSAGENTLAQLKGGTACGQEEAGNQERAMIGARKRGRWRDYFFVPTGTAGHYTRGKSHAKRRTCL